MRLLNSDWRKLGERDLSWRRGGLEGWDTEKREYTAFLKNANGILGFTEQILMEGCVVVDYYLPEIPHPDLSKEGNYGMVARLFPTMQADRTAGS